MGNIIIVKIEGYLVISSRSTKLHIQIKVATISIYLRCKGQIISSTCKGKLRNILCTYHGIVRLPSYSYLSGKLISYGHTSIHRSYQALTCVWCLYRSLCFSLPLLVSIGYWSSVMSYQAVYYLILTGWNYGTSCL